MNIGLLKTFLEVARLGHFGRAAERVFLTQSAVSARIKLLEESLGTPLFIRQHKQVELTAAGRRLADSAERIIKQWEQTRNEIQLLGEDQQQLLRVGTVFDLWTTHMQSCINRIKDQHPEIIIQLQAANAPLLNQKILSDELDIALVFDPPYHGALEVTEAGQLELILVSDQPLNFTQVHQQDYYYVDWGISFSDQHGQLLDQILHPVISFNFANMAQDMLLQRGGMAYLSRQQVDVQLQQNRLHIVDGAPDFQRSLFTIYRKNHPQHLLLNVLTQLFQNNN